MLADEAITVEILKPAKKGCFVRMGMTPFGDVKATCELENLDEKGEDWKKCQGRLVEAMTGAQ